MSNRIVRRSIYGSSLQTKKLMGLPFEMVPNTTLNEKFGIMSGIAPSENQMPDVRYFAIGNGGHRQRVGSNSIPYTTPIEHRASHASLYNHIPFVLREINDDLSPERRAQYGLRIIEEHNGTQYFAYYLKRLDLSEVDETLHITTIQDGVSTRLPFEPTSSELNPTPPEVPSEGVIPTNGNTLETAAMVNVDFTAEDVAELVNVAEVLYDNPNLAIVSEVALCSGVDRTISAPAVGNTTINFKEVIACQIASFISTYYPLTNSNKGFDFDLEMGAVEPLLGQQYGE